MTTTEESAVVSLFKQKALIVAAKVVERKDMQEALSYTVDICEKKEPCELLLTGSDGGSACAGVESCTRAAKKMIAAPGLNKQHFAALEKQGKEKGFTVIHKGMRGYLPGIDVVFTAADLGIAETATCVLASNNEDTRLATMVSEIHIVALAKSKIVNSLEDAENFLNNMMRKGTMFTSFITGPSRTADIERVLTIGVHGPLELHVVLLEK
jgi:L-lactate dehydrogenase complex protein LldG